MIAVDGADEDVEEDEGLFDSGMLPTTTWVDSIDNLYSAFQDDRDSYNIPGLPMTVSTTTQECGSKIHVFTTLSK